MSNVFVCRRLVRSQTCTTVCACWRRRGSAWYLEVALVREEEPSTSGQYWKSPLLHHFSYTGTSNECFELNVRGLKDYFYSSDANQTPLFRMTILPPTEKLKIVLKKISDFHMRITKEFSD